MEVVIFVVHVSRLPSHHYDNVMWQLISMYNIQAARRVSCFFAAKEEKIVSGVGDSFAHSPQPQFQFPIPWYKNVSLCISLGIFCQSIS